jgi:hypothetical protein
MRNEEWMLFEYLTFNSSFLISHYEKEQIHPFYRPVHDRSCH